MKFNVILACGGKGTRADLGYNKLALDIGGQSVLDRTLSCFFHKNIDKIIISYNKDDYSLVEVYEDIPQVALCQGGDTRTASVANALALVEDDCDYVIIHDGARPYLPRECLERAMDDAIKFGTSVLYTQSTDSLRAIDGITSRPIDRKSIVRIQTPQIFPADEIKRAYLAADGEEFTDDASLYESRIGKPVHLTLGSDKNVKITTPEDCERALGGQLYIGNGWDTHRLAEGRDLILGGLKIDHDKGLVAHSDGDVLIHAIMDAILAAMHERDIGFLFPDTDSQFKDISSVVLLRRVLEIVKTKNMRIKSVSAVIMAQKPKLSPMIPDIQTNLANVMGISEDSVSLTATTTEKLGMVGREEGISVSCVVLLTK